MNYFLPSNDFHYCRVLLFSWECTKPPTSLSETNGEFFIKQIENYVSQVGNKRIVINCNNVVDIDDHFIDPIAKFVSKAKFDILFFSDDEKHELIRELKDNLTIDREYKFTELGDINAFEISNGDDWLADVKSTVTDAKCLEKDSLKRVVKDCFCKFDEENILSSTPLKTSGRFNAMDIISDPHLFRWFVLNLVEDINRTVIHDKPEGYTLVAASLRGSVLAGAVHELLLYISGSDLYLIDHIGPKHHIYEMSNTHNFEQSNYCIYIGDFLIAGTELKITQAYCQFTGGNINHAFVIGKYTDVDILNNQIKLHSLVRLKDCVDGLSYTLE